MNEILARLDASLQGVLRLPRRVATATRVYLLERKLLTDVGKWALRLLYRGELVPVARALFLRRLGRGENTLLPRPRAVITTGAALRDHFLASQLRDTELGDWSVGAGILNFLELEVKTHRPQVVLEFGSGVSTACLVRYMQELHGDARRVYVFSIEQDRSFAQRTLRLLEALQLERHARVVHSPLSRQVIEGVETTYYDMPGDFLHTFLQGDRPDFVVIDGPTAVSGARFGTLPLVRFSLSPRAVFFLDDALRDVGLNVAEQWSGLPYLQIHGVSLIGKGILVGQVVGTT